LKLKISTIIICSILSGCIIPLYTAKISLKGNPPINQTTISRVLIVGGGPVGSRVFMENLSEEMIQSFKKKGIECEYSYVGKPNSHIKLDTLINSKYDSYIVFDPKNIDYLNMTNPKYETSVGTAYGNQYVEEFLVSLYSNKPPELIWQGKLSLDFDLANEEKYKKISQLIFKEFSNHKFIPK